MSRRSCAISTSNQVDEKHGEREAYQTVALLSALSVVAEWNETTKLAHSTSDPTTLLPYEEARSAAQSDAELLGQLAYRVRVLALTDTDEDGVAAGLLRRMDRALLLRRMGRVGVRLHQHLLSLYPSVGEDVVEQIRTLEPERKALASTRSQAFEQALSAYVDSCVRAVRAVHGQVGEA